MQRKKETNDRNKTNRNTSYYKSLVGAGVKQKKETSDFMDRAKKRQLNNYRLAIIVLLILMIAFAGLILLGAWLNSIVGTDEENTATVDSDINGMFTTQDAGPAASDDFENPNTDVEQSTDISKTFLKYNGVYLDAQKLEDLESLQIFIDRIKSKGINAVNIDIKTEDGAVPYHVNGNTDSVMMGTGQISVPIEDIINTLHENELYVSGTIACFKDSLASTTWVSYALQDASEAHMRWQDADGSYWLNPYSEDARNYIKSIVEDSAKLGFDEIILSWFFFPSANANAIAYGNDETSKYTIIKEFVTDQRYVLDGVAPGVKLGLSIPLVYFLNMPNEAMGLNPSDLADRCNFFATSFAPSGVPSNVQINGSVISSPDSSPFETVKALCGHFDYLINSSIVNFRPYLQAFGGYGEHQIINQQQALEDCGISVWQLVNYDNYY